MLWSWRYCKVDTVKMPVDLIANKMVLRCWASYNSWCCGCTIAPTATGHDVFLHSLIFTTCIDSGY